MELSVLERQRAMLQSLFHTDHSWSWSDQQHDHLHHPSYSLASPSNNESSVTKLPTAKPDWQCNSSLANRRGNTKKRKAEFVIEEERKGKGAEVEAEEAGEERSEITTKTERETSVNTCSKESSKVSEVQKPDYIHVRARRGQATDSHSLAERARREKISKKMKHLQDLVPGCNKVTGKAGMLDEIINYVQSLEKQVEFLSMKLAAINPTLDFGIDNIFAKEVIFSTFSVAPAIPPAAYIASLPAAAAQFEAANSTCFQYNPTQQGTSNCGADVHVAMDQSQILPQKAGTSSLPIPEMLIDSSYISQLQQISGWESDWQQSLFTAGFH